jgi:hypothetical protein
MTWSIASLRERIEQGPRRSRPVMLAKGLAVYGETPANARKIHRQAVDDYFRPDFQSQSMGSSSPANFSAIAS